MTRPAIAVYTPMLNEAKHVERWYESAKQADLLVVGDTGSSDSTVELARSFGIVVHELWIEPFRFDDARNATMQLLPRNIDICIQLDADEVLIDNWRADLDTVSPDHNRWSYWMNSVGGAWGQVRRANCVRLGKGYRWEHPVHEIISGPPADTHLESVIIEHRPDGNKSRDYLLPMLQHFSAEQPDNMRLLFYLGREQMFRNDWVAARETLWRYVRQPKATYSAEVSEAYILLAKMDDDPERWLWKAIATEPRRREPFVDLAMLRVNQNDVQGARAMLTEASRRTDPSIYTTRADSWGEPFDRLCKQVESLALTGAAQENA